MSAFDLFEIPEAGTVSTVCFIQQIDDFSHRTPDLHEQLARFVGDKSCLKQVIDLCETTYLPSSVLGVLVQLHTGGCEVHLANASGDVAEAMQVTQLNWMFHVNEVEVGSWDKVTGAELVRIPLEGYGLTCPECLHETLVDRHLLEKRTACSECCEDFSVAAIREASHVFANCCSCETRLRVCREEMNAGMPCPQCDALVEVCVIA